MSDRPLRSCDVCGQIDDHPRHVYLTGPEVLPVNQAALDAVWTTEGLSAQDAHRIAKELEDTSIMQMHMDCCRERGCPDGSCNRDEVVGLQGNALLAAITGEKVK